MSENLNRLLRDLDSGKNFKMIAAADLLGKLGSNKVVPALLKIAEQYDVLFVRIKAIEALGRIGDKRSIEFLKKALNDPKYPDIRNEAARALGRIGDNSVIKNLIDALPRGYRYNQITTIEALGQIRDKDAISSLVQLVRKNSDDFITIKAAQVLRKLGDKSTLPSLIKTLRQNEKSEVFIKVAESLLDSGDKALTPTLFNILEKSMDSNIRIEAAEAIWILGDENASKKVIYFLDKEKDPKVRNYLIEAIRRFGDKESVPYLITALDKDREIGVRNVIIDSLGKLGDESAVPALIKILEQEKIRGPAGVALEALGRLGDERAIEPMLKCLNRVYLNENLLKLLVRNLWDLLDLDFIDRLINNILGEEDEVKKASYLSLEILIEYLNLKKQVRGRFKLNRDLIIDHTNGILDFFEDYNEFSEKVTVTKEIIMNIFLRSQDKITKKEEFNKPGIFLSHCHKDREFAYKLAKDLKEQKIKVWIDEAEINVGDSLIEKIRDGIDDMDYLGVILTPDSVKSEWVKKEVDIAMNQEIEGKRIKVLPFLLKDCELPGFLKGKVYIDFRDEAKYYDGFRKIVRKMLQEKKT